MLDPRPRILRSSVDEIIRAVQALEPLLFPYREHSRKLTGKPWDEMGISDKVRMAQLIADLLDTEGGEI